MLSEEFQMMVDEPEYNDEVEGPEPEYNDEAVEPVRKKRRIMITETDEKEKKPKRAKKTLLKNEMLETYNSNVPTEERVNSLKNFDLYELCKIYQETEWGKRNGLDDPTFKKLSTQQVNNIVKKSNASRTCPINISLPALNTKDQYILAAARVFVEKYCRDGESGRLVIKKLAFECLNEEVKSEVYNILASQNVQDLYILEKSMYVPKTFRDIHKGADELRRNGITAVNFTMEL